MRLILAVLLLAAVSGVRADVDLALREDGVLYFEDNLPTHLLATVQSPTTVYLRRDLQTPLASLFAGQKIEIIGMSPEGFLIKGTYRNNSITGWISPGELPSDVDRAQIALAKKNQERRGQIAAVIARKQVIRGMTPDEVHQSLGDPDQTSSHTDGSGTSQNLGLHHVRECLADLLCCGSFRPAGAAELSGTNAGGTDRRHVHG